MDREQDIRFTFEDGVLKPDGPVDLPDGAKGVAHIREVASHPSPRAAARRNTLKALRSIGDSGAFNSGGRTLTRDQMHERR